MGLKDLVDKKGGKTSEMEDKTYGGVRPNYDNADKPPVGFEPNRPDVKYHVETKPCPRCACLSHMDDSGFSWDCPYPDCYIVSFTMGWNEWRSRSSNLFLSGVEVEGWEYKGEKE